MQVEQIMTKDVCSCGTGTNAASAAELMFKRNFGSLPIVDDGRVVGIVTDRDLFLAVGTGNRRPGELPVGEIMTRDLAFTTPGSDVRDALKIMAQRQLRRLPVVNDAGQLVGMLSLADIALRADDSVSADMLSAIRAVCDRRSRSRAAQREAFWSTQATA